MSDTLLVLIAGGALAWEVTHPGFMAGLLAQAGISIGGGGTGGTTIPGVCPTVEEVATSLQVTVWRVREALTRSGKTTCTLTLADFAGIPEVPGSVDVGGVASIPNPTGPKATWTKPTGGSGTWGGLTDAQIQAAFLAANGGDAAAAKAAWEAQHAAEVAQRGY